MTLPNFFIIGAAKAGTTTLYNVLERHPQVFMSPEKEPNFFTFPEGERPNFQGPFATMNKDAVTEINDYQHLFDAVTDEVAIGEATTRYISTPGAATRIAAMVPHAKIIAILRNPIDRAFSEFQMNVRTGLERGSGFLNALGDQDRRGQENWQNGRYMARGLYGVGLEAYFNSFPKSQLNISLYEDLADFDAFLHQTLTFLDIDPEFSLGTTERYNVGGELSNPLLRVVWRESMPLRDALRPYLPNIVREGTSRFIRSRRLNRLQMSDEARAHLINFYREDILKLQDLIGRDLTSWLSNI